MCGSTRSPLANPVAIAVAILVGLLLATHTSYQTFFDGAQFVHFLLGPAVVALAIPLRQNIAAVRRALLPMAAALLAGSLTAIVSAVAVAWALGADPVTIKSLIPKSVTAPIAMGIAQEIGGVPSLTAALVILTGVTGAMIGSPLLDLIGINTAGGARLRPRHRRARHRHRAVVSGKPDRRHLCRHRHGLQRLPHRDPGAAAAEFDVTPAPSSCPLHRVSLPCKNSMPDWDLQTGEGFDMRILVLAIVLAGGLSLIGMAGASAAPASGQAISQLTGHSSDVLQVRGGCGRGWHRGPRGGCRRN